MRVNSYTGCTFNSGDTLAVGMYSVRQVLTDEPALTSNVNYTIAAATPATGQSTITLTTNAVNVVPPFGLIVIGN